MRTLPSSLRARRRGVAWPIAVALAAAVALTGYSATADRANAHAGTGLVPGRGAWLPGGRDFVGFYRAFTGRSWVKVYCVSPASAEPSQVRLHTVDRLPDKSLRVTRLLAATLSAHGDARTAVTAEAVSQALNEEMGNTAAVQRRARALPHRVQQLADRYVAQARRLAGPYRLSLRLPSSPLPGQSAAGTITLRSGSSPATGTVTLRPSGNAETPSTVALGRSGSARFTYRTTGAGPVRLTASAPVLPTSLRASRTDPGTQLMLTWAPQSTVHAAAGYQAAGPGIGHRYSCSSECAGRPRVTLTACAPPDDDASRVVFRFGAATHSLAFPARRTGFCQSWSALLVDGTTVRAMWQYRTPHGWTNPLPAGGTFTVDCPRVPPVAVTVSYDCTSATLSAALGTVQHGSIRLLRNDTSHPMVLIVSGAITDRSTVQPAATATVQSYPISCGVHATVTVQAGVERSGGGYNYGQPVEVITP